MSKAPPKSEMNRNTGSSSITERSCRLICMTDIYHFDIVTVYLCALLKTINEYAR